MKLRQVIKGYKNCDCVRIQYIGRIKCEWSGRGIEHIIDMYCSELFDHEVENVYVDNCGRRNIVVSLESKKEEINRLEKECIELFIPVIKQESTTEANAQIFLNKINRLVELTKFNFKQIVLFIIKKSALLHKYYI